MPAVPGATDGRDARHDSTAERDGSGKGGELVPRRPRDWLREQRGLPRRKLMIAGAVVLIVFVMVSVLLARYLSTENAERNDVLALLKAEARGDPEAMIASLSDCRHSAGCVQQQQRNAAALRRPGSVKILTLSSQTAYTLTTASGTTRVAWTVIGRLPTVQCVGVTRTGSFLAGLSVKLTSLSAPIPGEADC